MKMGAALLRAMALWFGLLVLAVLNGSVREKLLLPALGERLALPASGLMLSALILAATTLAFPLLGRPSAGQCWRIGSVWAGMSAAFDFLFGRFVRGQEWASLLAAYDPRGGNLWLLVLAATACAPYVAARLRGR